MSDRLETCAEVPAQVDLLSCDNEPIHLPGAIQRFGILLAIDFAGNLRRVSANLCEFLPLTPARVLGTPVESVLGEEAGARCRAFMPARGLAADDRSIPVFDAELPGASVPFTITMTDSPRGLIIECEPGTHGPLEYRSALRCVSESFERLRNAQGSMALLELAARIVAARCGFHRTMVYRFDSEMNGDIIIEVVKGVEPRWLDHHFPHSDIPAQARLLYLRNRIRMIADIDYTPAPLIGVGDDVRDPLDLSDVMLRSVSPIHVEYLKNMGVRATLTMSLIVEGRLWGMIVCHHGEPRYAHWPLRLFCDLIAQFVSLQLEQQLAVEQSLARRRLVRDVDAVMERMRIADSVGTAIGQSVELLHAWDADAFHLVLHGERIRHGREVPEALIQAIEAGLAGRDSDRATALERIGPFLDGRDIDCAWVAGVLFLPLSNSIGDHLLWLRGEQLREIKWAGQPCKDVLAASADKPARLSPRGSFETWIEEVRGRSLSWTAAEIHAAEYLAQVIRNQLANELKLSREREELIRRMALYDQLTGLPNRVLLMDRLQGAIERAKRCHQAFAVCFIDLDKFKPINDQFGHLEGDGALKAVATRLSGVLRQSDTLARVGGDELVVLIEEIDGESPEEVRAAAATVVHKVIRSLDEPILVGTRRHRLGASVGVCCYPEIRGEPDALLHIADTAMYVAKKGGSNPTFAEARGDH